MPPRALRIVTIAATAAIAIIACGGGSQPRSAGGAQNVAPAAGAGNAGILPKRERIDFLTPVPIGEPMAAGEHIRLAAILQVADYLAFAIGQGSGHEAYARALDPKALNLLRVTVEDIDACTEEVKEGFEKALAAFNK